MDLAIVTDNLTAAEAVAAAARASGDPIPVLIEIDSDGHRAGVPPEDRKRLVAIARTLAEGGAEPRGVMTHYGGSYNARTPAELDEAARREREAVLACAGTLRAAGFAAPVVSIGSTPTALSTRNLDGITEVRAGVYVFFDLVMAGHRRVHDRRDRACRCSRPSSGTSARRAGSSSTPAGWRCRATGARRGQAVDQGYGLVCDVSGRPYPDLIMTAANQEHGILSVRPGSDAALTDLPIGSQVRILPNHACATAAQFGEYHVLDAGSAVTARWPRFNGW